MNELTLNAFRQIADAMSGPESKDWQWIGPHLSQRMFGITESRAKEYAGIYGGEAKPMPTREELDAEVERILSTRRIGTEG